MRNAECGMDGSFRTRLVTIPCPCDGTKGVSTGQPLHDVGCYWVFWVMTGYNCEIRAKSQIV